MKRVVGYIRNSKSRKDVQRQEDVIKAYCESNDMDIVLWLCEEEFGAIAYGNIAGHKKVDAVIAASNKDVTENVFEFWAYRCKLQMRGIGLYVAEWSDYPGYGIHRKIFEQFTEVMCRKEFEHEPVRSATGRIRKASKGGYIGGQAPMGYKAVDGRLVVNAEEVPVVLFIMEEKHAGRTKKGTVEKLNASGYRTRNGGPFQISTVQGIWNNEKFYHGYYRVKGSDEWVKGQHEAILKD